MIFEGTKKSIFFGLGLTRAGKARPNIAAMRNIKGFCEERDYPYEEIEDEWLSH